MPQALTHALGDQLGRLDEVALHVDDPDGDVVVLGDAADEVELRHLPAGHLDVQLVDRHGVERREHRRVPPQADGAALVVPEAQVRRQAGPADDRRNRAVEDVDEAGRILAMGVAAHRRLVDGHLGAAGVDQRHELALHDRQQRLGDSPPVGQVAARDQAPAERVGARDAGLEHGPGRCETPQAGVLVDDAEAVRRLDRSGDPVAAALVMGRWSEPARRRALQLDAGEEPVEGQVEVETGLLTVGDHVEAGGDLVVDGGDRQRRPAARGGRPGRTRRGGRRRTPASPGAGSCRSPSCAALIWTVQPPSTTSVWPVTRRLSRLHRYTAASATSSASSMPSDERLLRAQELDRRFVAGRPLRHRRGDGGGSERVDADALPDVVGGGDLGQPEDRCLGGGVGLRSEVLRRWIERRDARHQDDGAAYAVVVGFLLEHPAHGLAGGQEARCGVERERGIPRGEADLVQRAVAEAPAAASGDGEGGVEASELLASGGERRTRRRPRRTGRPGRRRRRERTRPARGRSPRHGRPRR